VHAEAVARGKRIEALRKQRGISRAELARRIGKSGPYISLLERGERIGTFDTLEAIARALAASLEDLNEDRPKEGVASALPVCWILCLEAGGWFISLRGEGPMPVRTRMLVEGDSAFLVAGGVVGPWDTFIVETGLEPQHGNWVIVANDDTGIHELRVYDRPHAGMTTLRPVAGPGATYVMSRPMRVAAVVIEHHRRLIPPRG
jgi:transcriptional regulator with XRE-family HTH domain